MSAFAAALLLLLLMARAGPPCPCITSHLCPLSPRPHPPHTHTHNLQVVSSAIVDKYIGESARVIREMFGYAREHQPCVIFMDEIDAIGGRRFSEGTSADREIQRTLMELLSQLDGFDVVGKVRASSLACVCVCSGGVSQPFCSPSPSPRLNANLHGI